jgi:hypothetical protein
MRVTFTSYRLTTEGDLSALTLALALRRLEFGGE